MSDLAAAEAEAEEAVRGPRWTAVQGALLGFAGSAALSFVLTWVAVFLLGDGPLWVVLLAAFGYALALLVWAGLWKRPLQAAAVIGASLAGFFAGYLLAIFVANVLSGPDT